MDIFKGEDDGNTGHFVVVVAVLRRMGVEPIQNETTKVSCRLSGSLRVNEPHPVIDQHGNTYHVICGSGSPLTTTSMRVR